MLFGKHISKYYLKYAWIMLLGILALGLVDYIQLEIPELIGAVVDGINKGNVVFKGVEYEFNAAFFLSKICNPIIIIILLMFVCRFTWRICFIGTSFKVERDLRSRMFDKAKDLSQEYYSVNKVGSLMSLFTNDLETIQDCYGFGILMFFDAFLLGALAIYRMLKMNVILTLLSLIPMVFLLLAATVLGFFMEKKWDARQSTFSAISDFSQESFSGIAVIKSFVKEAKELKRFSKLSKDNENANISFTRLNILFDIFIELFVTSVICIILGVGGYLVYNGKFTPGNLIAYIGYFESIIWPVLSISELIGMTARGRASLKRIGELLDAKVDVKDREGVKDISDVKGNIEFRNLTFAYPGTKINVLNNVSFDIKAGENIGITGRTGAGKTSIVDLILRVYNVPDGTLFIDGEDVNNISIKSLRDNIAYVPQDNFLFGDTVKNNIAFAAKNVEEDAIIEVAKKAGVHNDIINFKDGYNTVLGERGITVSGGQKQRISIARAFLKEAPILILDDSVSAVDTKTENHIITALREERKGKTTILIAHRISTVEYMDKIIYVSDGKILDVGTHDELYSRCEEYKTSVDLQRLEREKEAISNG